MGYAVNSATARKNWPGIDEHYFAVGVALLENCLGNLIVLIVESAENHTAVDQVVIDIRIVDPTVTVFESLRCWHFTELETTDLFERAFHFVTHREVGVRFVLLIVKENLAAGGETGDYVDVTTSSECVVIAGEPSANPNRSLGAEFFMNFAFYLFAGPRGVSTLTQLNGLGHHHVALTINMDAATLID